MIWKYSDIVSLKNFQEALRENVEGCFASALYASDGDLFQKY